MNVRLLDSGTAHLLQFKDDSCSADFCILCLQVAENRMENRSPKECSFNGRAGCPSEPAKEDQVDTPQGTIEEVKA
jgi:hypothetical protein